MGAGAIQIEAVAAYFAVIGLEDLELREGWLDLIQQMDQVWLEHQARRQAEDEKAEKTGRK
jgi:hypothetical protein